MIDIEGTDLKSYSPKALSVDQARMIEDPNGEYLDKRDVLRELGNLQALVKKWRDLAGHSVSFTK